MTYYVYLIISKIKKKTISYVGYTKDLKKKYELKEIVKGDSIFCATGITTGELVKGIKVEGNKFTTETFVTHKSSNLSEIFISEDTIKT